MPMVHLNYPNKCKTKKKHLNYVTSHFKIIFFA